MADDIETTTFSIETDDGETDEITLPTGLFELLGEEGERPVDVFGDIAVLSASQQIHGAIHHSQGDASDAVKAVEQETLDVFEERFGQSFAEMTGHSH